MTARRPLVVIGGEARELPVGDTVVGATGSGSASFPFFTSNGTNKVIPVTAGSFPFFKSDGSPDEIGV